jgi:hypothetical protein
MIQLLSTAKTVRAQPLFVPLTVFSRDSNEGLFDLIVQSFDGFPALSLVGGLVQVTDTIFQILDPGFDRQPDREGWTVDAWINLFKFR